MNDWLKPTVFDIIRFEAKTKRIILSRKTTQTKPIIAQFLAFDNFITLNYLYEINQGKVTTNKN